MSVEVKRVEDLDKRLIPEVIEKHKGRWVVIDDSIIYDYFDTEVEAKKIAELLILHYGIIEELKNLVCECLSKLSKSELAFIQKLTGGKFEVEI